MASKASFKELHSKMREIKDIGSSIALLNWDQEVNMAAKGAATRSGQIATLSGLSHDRFTGSEMGELLERLGADGSLSDHEQRNVKVLADEYGRLSKYSREFVENMSKAVSAAYHSWNKAKEAKDFGLFREELTHLVGLKREEAGLIGYEAHPYDALLNEYEKGCKSADLITLFDGVKAKLVDYVKEIGARPQVNDDFLFKHYNKDSQWEFGLWILKQMGYDFDAGRQDISPHPFTISFGSQDVRVTTRISENNFNEMTWSCIHEGGHALYEQGLKAETYGLPESEAVSLGIHESQSRLWENNVGRSLPYWEANFADLQKRFPENLSGVSVEQFYKAINKVAPSLVRTSADELTYHFHVLIRFEIEMGLISGETEVKDLPEIWNAKYKDYLGVEVPSVEQGVLQDIHWSHGSFGYFPTYSLGSFYAAQFHAQAEKEISGLEEQVAKGDMRELLAWLRKKVHVHGSLYTADELCNQICGESLNFDHFWSYARKKYDAIYGI